MGRALSKREVALLRMMANNWYQSGQLALNQQVRRLGASGTAQAGNIDWGQVTNQFIATERAEQRAQTKKDDESFYNNYYKALEGPGRIRNYGSASAIEELYNRVQNQRGTAASTDTDISSVDRPSVLQRIFDVIQRPNFAVAEAVRREHQAKERGENVFQTIDDSIKGLIAGITGKKKTTFADVLEEGGLTGTPIKGKDLPSRLLRGAGGFALDVVADPTTYVGLGLVKKAGKEAIERAGKEAVEKAFKPGSPVYDVGRQAIAKASKTKTGRVRKLSRPDQIKIFNEAVTPHLPIVSQTAMGEAAELGAGRFALKVLGQEIGTGAGFGRKLSEKAYAGASGLGKILGDTPVGQAVNAGFRTRYKMPGILHRYQRMFNGRGVSDLQHTLKELDVLTKPLTKKDSEIISRAMESGTVLPKVGSRGHLGKIQEELRALEDQMFAQEVIMGYRKPRDYRPNYVPHYAKRGTVSEQQSWHNAIDMSFDEAIQRGWKPNMDIRQLVAHRAGRFYQRKVQYDLVKQLEQEFGLKTLKAKSVKTAPTKQSLKTAGLVQIKHPTAQKGVWVPPVVADFVEEMKKLTGDPEYARDLLRIHDTLLNTWKTAVTVVNPGFHVRNTIGDIFLNWMANVRSPIPYQKAARVVANGRLGKTVSIAGRNIPVEDVHHLYDQAGLDVGFFRTELGKTVPGTKHIRKASESREEWARMTHFIDKLEKVAKKRKIKFTEKDAIAKLKAIAEEIGDDVRKFNIDYGDLTPFEKNIAKRMIPFYTWMRKSTPILLESLFLNPGKFAKLPKGQRAIEHILGTDEREAKLEDSIPKWMKDYSALRLSGGDEPEFIGAGSVLPIQFLGEFSGGKDIAKYFAGMSNPLAQTIAEQATGTKIFTGGPIEDDTSTYLSGKTPGTRLGKKAIAGELEGQDLINYLLGLSYRKVDENDRLGELYRQEGDIRKILKKRKKELEGQLK